MLSLERDEEVRKGKGQKILTSDKILTRLPYYHYKNAVNNSYKLKCKIRQILYLL